MAKHYFDDSVVELKSEDIDWAEIEEQGLNQMSRLNISPPGFYLHTFKIICPGCRSEGIQRHYTHEQARQLFFNEGWRQKDDLWYCPSCSRSLMIVSQDELYAFQILKDWLEQSGGDPWITDDYANTKCFFCRENKPNHADDCIFVRAMELVEKSGSQQ